MHTIDDDSDWGFIEHPSRAAPPQVCVIDLSPSPPGADGDGYEREALPLREAIVRYVARHTDH
ncbi:hypothetical protein [Nocardioides xinjiangensis]|uniref:hypothetical protein n=1 Tax=Nocardioides xinjiangensis TaxID=2817376 RepID=UPI001B30FC4F|nr:hypothetical protein [Nocardioides sp. SYSU D00778]